MLMVNNNKKLLIIGSLPMGTIEIIKYAKSIGVYTIVTDWHPIESSEAKSIADEAWMISVKDIDELEKKSRQTGVSAIICGLSEEFTDIAVELSERLNLPFYCTKESWHYSRNKADFKELCRKVNVPTAKEYYISTDFNEDELKNVEYPVVVKAINLCSNKGMSFCNNKDELITACKYAREVSKENRVVVEKRLFGSEYVAWYALADGESELLDFACMIPQTGYPSSCYLFHSTYTDRKEQFLKELDCHLKKLLKAAGCREGIAWFEIMSDIDNGLYVLEMGYRMSGEMMMYSFCETIGFDSFKWLTDISLGVKHTPSDLPKYEKRQFGKIACSYILWSKLEGVVTSIEGVDEIDKIKNIHVIPYNCKINNKINAYSYVYVIPFIVNNYIELLEIIEKINNTISVKIGNEDALIRFTDFHVLLDMNIK